MRRAHIRTTHDSPVVVADSVRPDNTTSMTTRVDGDVVETVIERETTGGLHSSVDDYVVNITVADRLASLGDDDGERSGDDVTATDDRTATDDMTVANDAQPDDDSTPADTATAEIADTAAPTDDTDDTDNTDDTHE